MRRHGGSYEHHYSLILVRSIILFVPPALEGVVSETAGDVVHEMPSDGVISGEHMPWLRQQNEH